MFDPIELEILIRIAMQILLEMEQSQWATAFTSENTK